MGKRYLNEKNKEYVCPLARPEEIRWFCVMEKTTWKRKKMAKNYTFKNLTGGNKIHAGF